MGIIKIVIIYLLLGLQALIYSPHLPEYSLKHVRQLYLRWHILHEMNNNGRNNYPEEEPSAPLSFPELAGALCTVENSYIPTTEEQYHLRTWIKEESRRPMRYSWMMTLFLSLNSYAVQKVSLPPQVTEETEKDEPVAGEVGYKRRARKLLLTPLICTYEMEQPSVPCSLLEGEGWDQTKSKQLLSYQLYELPRERDLTTFVGMVQYFITAQQIPSATERAEYLERWRKARFELPDQLQKTRKKEKTYL